MPEQETEAVTEVTGDQDDYLSYDTAYINENLFEINNKLGDIAAKFDVMNESFTDYTGIIGNELTGFSERFVSITDDLDYLNDRVDVMYQSSLWNILLLGLISGILFVLVFTGGRK